MIKPLSLHRVKYYLRRSLKSSSSKALFIREWIAKPAVVGSVWPSSRQLARRLAEQVPIDGEGLVVELGAGTGAVTQALLARGIDPARLVVIERSPTFVHHLRIRFPHVTVVQGDATLLSDLLPANSTIAAIVSGLPLRSLPKVSVSAIVSQWRLLLASGGILVQFTYDLRLRLNPVMRDFTLHDTGIAWGNLPPARVLTLGLLAQ